MAAIRCPHCGKYTSSKLQCCTECKKPLNETPSPRRITDRLYLRVYLAVFVVLLLLSGASWTIYSSHEHSRQLEEEAYALLDSCMDLQAYEEFMVRYPQHDSAAVVRERYEALKAAEEERIRLAAEEAEARARELRLTVTPEETALLRGVVENVLSAMTARDSVRMDELVPGEIEFCGQPSCRSAQMFAFYDEHFQQSADVLGVHFQLGETTVRKQFVAETDSLYFDLSGSARATINRSALDSVMTSDYNLSATFSQDKRLATFTLQPAQK